jgi:hypothetical protein
MARVRPAAHPPPVPPRARCRTSRYRTACAPVRWAPATHKHSKGLATLALRACDPVGLTTPSGRRGLSVAKQGYLAPQDPSGAGQLSCFSFCRSLYALAMLFPPKLSARKAGGRLGEHTAASSLAPKWHSPVAPNLSAQITGGRASAAASAATVASPGTPNLPRCLPSWSSTYAAREYAQPWTTEVHTRRASTGRNTHTARAKSRPPQKNAAAYLARAEVVLQRVGGEHGPRRVARRQHAQQRLVPPRRKARVRVDLQQVPVSSHQCFLRAQGGWDDLLIRGVRARESCQARG